MKQYYVEITFVNERKTILKGPYKTLTQLESALAQEKKETQELAEILEIEPARTVEKIVCKRTKDPSVQSATPFKRG